MSDLDFSGQKVLVVGGSTGIGNGIAQAFRQRGAEVLVTGTREAPASYADVQGADFEGLTYSRLDLSDPTALDRWADAPQQLDVLILCHAVTYWGRQEFEMETFRKVMEVNVNSLMACAMRFKPALAAAKGSITMISSNAAFRTLKSQPAYTASKTAMLGLTRALAASFITDGIRVNCIAPGIVPTKMGAAFMTEDRLKAALRVVPIGRTGTTQELAGAALFLSSPLASYVVGHTLVVDGGMMCSA